MSYHMCSVCMAAGPSRMVSTLRRPVAAAGRAAWPMRTSSRAYSDAPNPGLFSRFKTMLSGSQSETSASRSISFKERQKLPEAIDAKLIKRPWETRADKAPRIDVATGAAVPPRDGAVAETAGPIEEAETPLEEVFATVERRSEEQRAAGRRSGQAIIQEVRKHMAADKAKATRSADRKARTSQGRDKTRGRRTPRSAGQRTAEPSWPARKHADLPVAFYDTAAVPLFKQERDRILAQFPPSPDDSVEQRQERFFAAYIAPLWTCIDHEYAWDPQGLASDNTERLLAKFQKKHSVCWRSVTPYCYSHVRPSWYGTIMDSVAIEEDADDKVEEYILEQLLSTVRDDIKKYRHEVVFHAVTPPYYPIMPTHQTERTQQLFATYCDLVGALTGQKPTPRPWDPIAIAGRLHSRATRRTDATDMLQAEMPVEFRDDVDHAETSITSLSSEQDATSRAPQSPVPMDSHRARLLLLSLQAAIFYEVRANHPLSYDQDSPSGLRERLQVLRARCLAQLKAVQVVVDYLTRPDREGGHAVENDHSLLSAMLGTPLYQSIHFNLSLERTVWQNLIRAITYNVTVSGLPKNRRSGGARFDTSPSEPCLSGSCPPIRLHHTSPELDLIGQNLRRMLQSILSALPEDDQIAEQRSESRKRQGDESATAATVGAAPKAVRPAHGAEVPRETKPVEETADLRNEPEMAEDVWKKTRVQAPPRASIPTRERQHDAPRKAGEEHGIIEAEQAVIAEVPGVSRKVASLQHGLDRVLFNPTVHFMRDPRSLVFSFDPDLEQIPQADTFAFERLPPYITASRDGELLGMAQQNGARFYGSTSTLTTALSQLYFLVSGERPVDTASLSQSFNTQAETQGTFTAGARLPATLVLRPMPGGTYAVDNDKTWDVDEENILSDLGRVLEKVLTTPKKDLKRFLRSAPESAVSPEERNAREAYHYCKGSTLLMRSQLDCHDPRLPGSGTFDIKTRAAMPIRQDRANYAENSAYDIAQLTGIEESFEKEYYDMIRSAFLKYSMQVRIGGMDGIFVAYHNTRRLFGFQYISLAEMDKRLHGTSEMGAQAFALSVTLLEKILHRAADLFPNITTRLIVEKQSGHVKVFIEPERTLSAEEMAKLTGNESAASAKPVVALTLRIVSRLNGQEQTGPIDFESVAGKPANVDWTIEYDIQQSPLNSSGFAEASTGQGRARQRQKNMSSLALPTNKTAEDMALAHKRREEQLARAAELVAKEAEGVLPAQDNSYAPSQTVKWRAADPRVLRIRSLARESGRKYKQRVGSSKGKRAVAWARR